MFAKIDLFIQTFVQMPFFYSSACNGWFERLGIRKIWIHPLSDKTSAYNYNYESVVNMGHAQEFDGLTLDLGNWYMQIAIGIMICMISLQVEIFESHGYQKYVT